VKKESFTRAEVEKAIRGYHQTRLMESCIDTEDEDEMAVFNGEVDDEVETILSLLDGATVGELLG
jgi:hypothetical protein